MVEANLQLEDTTLRAPYDGVIAQRFVEEGQNVRAKEPVVRFQDVDEIDIVVDVPETVMVADIRSADIVQMVAEFSGAPGLAVSGRRSGRSRKSPTRRRRPSRSASPMKSPPGMQRAARHDGHGHRSPTAAPASWATGFSCRSPPCSRTPRGEQVAWVVGAGWQTVARRPVKLGEATGGQIEIAEGLQPGDRIAVAGVTFLREGMKVRDLGDALGGGQP